MSYTSEYLKAVKQMEEDRKKKQKTSNNSSYNYEVKNYWDPNANIQTVNFDISPIRTTVTDKVTVASTVKKKEEDDNLLNGWFQKGALRKGLNAENISKAILGTLTDVGQDLTTGIVGMGEKALDALMTIAPYSLLSSDPYTTPAVREQQSKIFEEAKKESAEFVKKDLYNEEEVSKKLLSNMYGNFGNVQKVQNGQMLSEEDLLVGRKNTKVAQEYMDNQMEVESVFGEKADSVVQSGGQLLGTIGLQTVGVPWWLTTGATAFGGEAENAFNEGATHEEALLSSTIAAGAEILTEKIFGGIKFGGKALDDALTDQIARGISNKFVRKLSKFGLDAFGEGAEEWITEDINKFAQWLTYRDEEELKELLFSEDAIDEKIEAFLGGAALGGVSNVSNVVKSKVEGVDSVSGLTKNEESVVKKVYDALVAEEVEKNGKATQKRKSEIYNEVLNRLENGYISTETIEEVLGGDTYNSYKNSIYKDQRNQLKTQLGEEVFNLVQSENGKGSRLLESYNEVARRSQAFEADLSQYDTEQQKTIQKAIESGVLNNTNRSHEMVDLIAKISADKGIVFDFTNNEKIKGTIFAVEGKIVNGYKTADGITLNVDSPKYLQSTVGHEITHVLEGTELYDTLRETIFNYAISKEGLDSFNARLKAVEEMYKDIDGADFEGELAADLVGDYLFQDSDFVHRLSTENRNVFQKIYDEIKYLCKVVTAGSKEARELEKVKKAFEDAYRANIKNTADRGVKYSVRKDIVDVNGKEYDSVVELDKTISKRTMSNPKQFLNYIEKNLVGLKIPVMDASGNIEVIEFARANETTSKNGKRHPVLGELGYTKGDTRKQVIVNAKEVIEESLYDPKYSSTNNDHGWLDENGWESRKTYVLTQDGNIFEAYLKIAKARDGRNILYAVNLDINNGIAVDKGATSKRAAVLAAMPSGEMVAQNGGSVKHSLSDSTGKALTNEQAEFFKDSKVVDENGNLKVMYHGTSKGGHTVFDSWGMSKYGLFGTGSYFTDSKSIAESYTKKGKGNNPQVYETYLNIKNPIDMDAQADPAEWADAFTDVDFPESGTNEDFYRVVEEYYADQYMPKWEVAEIIRDSIEFGMGYDGITHVGGGRVNPDGERHQVYIAFEPEQIKNTDNLKPTSNPDIRYSLSDEVTDEQNELGLDAKSEVQFSLSRDTEYMDKAIAQNNSSLHVDTEAMNAVKALRERIATRMKDIKDRGLVGLPEDIEGNTYIANSSYDGTEENTTICPRSLASEAFTDAVSEYLGRPLTVEEQIYISQDLQGRSMTPECTYCYVATDRKAYRAFLGEYISQRDAVLEKVQENPSVDVSRSGELYKEFLNGRKDTNPMYSRFKMWVDTYKNGKPMIDASHLANINKLMGDINSEFGTELKPQIVDAMKYAQSASWAKKRVNYVAYNGHILKWKQDRINKLNSHYGLRMYSFSDFHPAFVLENMQMITDASVRGLKMLGYTKDTDFVEIFAPSGMNINVSTFGFETGGNVYENNIIGAEWDKARALREQYPNVGVTFVATNDHLVEWALEQDWIDVVIPYHLVRTGAEVAKAFGYTNYTSESSDTKTKEWAKGDKKYIAPTEHNNDKATYLAALDKNHLNPRFERFLDNPNYMKLVNECRQPASVSKPVQPIFNEDAAMVALAKLEANGYYQPIGGSVDRMYEIAAEVAGDMQSQLAPAMSLSNIGETPKRYGDFATPATDLRLEAPVKTQLTEESATPNASVDEDIAPYEDNGSQKRVTRKELHQSIVDKIKSTFNAKGFDFDEVLKKAKNLSTFATVDNIPQRVMEKSLGYKEGGILADITVNKVAQNESEGIKWLNSFTDRKNGLLAQLSKQYNIKPGSKESAAAQMYAEGFYVDGNNNIIQYGDAELAADFKNPKVRENIKKLASDPRIRRVYDETLASINASRTRNAYPEIPRLDNYFLHFRAMEDTFSRLGLPFNPNEIRAKDLPTDLNGVTADLKPGQPYFASAMHREGKRTSFDLLGGLERYLTSAKNQIYHIDDIQTLRALRNYIADTYGQANGLEGLDALSETEAEERIKQVYSSHLSTFAKFLNEEANILAGKTALIDRGLEGIIGRRGITFLNTINQQVGANMVGWNISSSLTNFLPVAQTFAKTNKFDFTKAFAQTVANKISGGKLDTFTEDSPVVIRRKGADRFYRTPWQKLADPGYVFISAVDDISTELIARTKYNEFVRKGMDSQKAHYETDKWVSRLMGDRSLGQMPQLYNSKMLGLITKFQLEVRNQLDSQFYDTIQETKTSNENIQNGILRNAKTAAKVASVVAQLMIAQHLYGKAFESVAGYNPAFDIIEVLMTAFGFDDDEESEDTVLDNLAQGLLELSEDLPYASTFTGGRIPISAAIPDVGAILEGEDEYGNEIGFVKALVNNVKEIAPYYLFPSGYGQFKKTKAGLKMFSDDHPVAGSYTESGNLRFPVEDTPKNKVKAAIFGQYASENARKYFAEEQKTLNPEQTEIFAGLDIPIEEYWEYRDNLNDFYDLKDELEAIADEDGATNEDILKSIYISSVSSDIYKMYEQQKEIASGDSSSKQSQLRELQRQMETMLSGSKSALDNVSAAGAYAEVGNRRYNYDAEKNTWYEIKPKKADGTNNYFYQQEQKVTKGLGISYEEYWNNREEYNFAYENPTKYSLAKAVGGYDSYRRYTEHISTLKADKDEYGESISGTQKAKVYDYIFNQLDADYGEKILLYRSMYGNADDKNAYNFDIVMYLFSRDDITYEEMEKILISLDFKIDSNGNISW